MSPLLFLMWVNSIKRTVGSILYCLLLLAYKPCVPTFSLKASYLVEKICFVCLCKWKMCQCWSLAYITAPSPFSKSGFLLKREIGVMQFGSPWFVILHYGWARAKGTVMIRYASSLGLELERSTLWCWYYGILALEITRDKLGGCNQRSICCIMLPVFVLRL